LDDFADFADCFSRKHSLFVELDELLDELQVDREEDVEQPDLFE
jgi:hypothetical protein